MKPEINQTKSIWPLIVLTALILVFLAQPAPAVNKQWVGDNFLNLYFWTSSNNWSPPGEPGAGDFVLVTQSDAKNRLIWYNTELNPVLDSLTVNATGSGQITLWQLNNTALSAGNERIGSDGTGCYVQIGGTNTVNPNDLTLGGDPPGEGAYTLKGGSLQVSRDEFIGREGIGNFTQIDGTNSVDDELILCRFQGSKGNYTMYGGNLLVGGVETIGWRGVGAATQIDGTHTVLEDLRLGYEGPGTGTYELKFGSLEVGKDEFIGFSGTGGVTQTGGQTTVAERLILAGNPGSSGSYHLKFGSLSVGTDEYIGNEAPGVFDQLGGTHTVDGDLDLGRVVGGSGTYHLKGGSLSVGNDEYVGHSGIGVFTQSYGTHQIRYNLNLGYDSTSSGTYKLGPFGSLAVGSNEYIGVIGTGTFNQCGGTNTTPHLILASLLDTSSEGVPVGNGTYNLEGGSLSVSNSELIGVIGPGTFNQCGGTNTTPSLELGTSLVIFESNTYQGNGTYNLDRGSLSVSGDEVIGGYGIGNFNQTGGKNTVANTLTLAVQPGSSGTYNLSGGKLTAGTIQINAPAGGGAGGVFNVMNTITTVTGDVVNDGTVKTTNAIVTWDGNFTNNGAYISDPSKQTFTGDLEVGADGSLTGASQDLFIIKGDFINRSENTDDWDTALATLKFAKDASGDTEHNFFIPGEDNGPSGTNAFAWDTLNILGQTVQLRDGNFNNFTSFGPGAQYVGGLIGAEVNWADKVVNNIFGAVLAVNIYYDPDLLINAYLLGLTYDFANGPGHGQLIPDPSAAPLPASVLLLGSGLLGLGLLGYRRKRS